MRSCVERQNQGAIHLGKHQEAKGEKKEGNFLKLEVQGDQISLVASGNKFFLLTIQQKVNPTSDQRRNFPLVTISLQSMSLRQDAPVALQGLYAYCLHALPSPSAACFLSPFSFPPASTIIRFKMKPSKIPKALSLLSLWPSHYQGLFCLLSSIYVFKGSKVHNKSILRGNTEGQY